MSPRNDLTPLMLPVGHRPGHVPAPLAAPARAAAPGLIRQHDLLLAAPAVLAILAGVLVRAV
ncbi:MAG: hypothetical protein ACKO04_00860 [Actinomycetes bacterium]